MTRGAGGWLAGALAAALLSGCAVFADPGRVAPGTPAAGVVEQLGRPTARYPAAGNAGERLQYTYQPAGQRIQPNVWTRADVLREYGPPARTMGVHNFDGTIWIWRYADGPTWRLLFIDIDRAGVVRGWSNGDEDLPDPPDVR